MANEITTPKGMRLCLGAFGRRNVGKSSLLNALTGQEFAIVSEEPGATTDPVERTLEFAPFGAAVVIDTAGIDDFGTLGEKRVAKTKQVFDRVDAALLTLDAALGSSAWSEYETELVEQMRKRGIPVLVVANKADLASSEQLAVAAAKAEGLGLPWTAFSALRPKDEKLGIKALKEALIKLMPEVKNSAVPIVSDLVAPGEFVVLVTPIDAEAPKGRLILPQVQTIRDLLDAKLGCVVVQENMLEEALKRTRPALVVTDSQAFKNVAAIVPKEIPLTSFSILFARQKGDLAAMTAGARAIAKLTPGSRVLIAEACAHHPVEEDIGTVKIPKLLRKRVGEALRIDHVRGRDFPSAEALQNYDLVIHCGACMFNRREMAARIVRAEEAGTVITNYGLTLAFLNGILERAIEPLGL